MCWLKRKSFLFYASYLEAANTLKAKERDTLYRVILEYGILGTEPQLKGHRLHVGFSLSRSLMRTIASMKTENEAADRQKMLLLVLTMRKPLVILKTKPLVFLSDKPK